MKCFAMKFHPNIYFWRNKTRVTCYTQKRTPTITESIESTEKRLTETFAAVL